MNYSEHSDLIENNMLRGVPFRSKEVSWLSFNGRVLQESEDPDVPLLERLRFLGIYSSNLDEFFRVRVATLRRLVRLGEHFRELRIPDPKVTLREIHDLLVHEAARYDRAYDEILKGLAENGIRLITENQVPKKLQPWLTDYFLSEIRPRLMPILLKGDSDLSSLRDHPMYLAIRMKRKEGSSRTAYALIEIPTHIFPRFVELPTSDDSHLVMYLDDIIRFGLASVFSSLPYDQFEAFAVKFTRDSEMQFDDDFTESVYQKVSEGLRARITGNPVRINYDSSTPESVMKILRKKLNFSEEDTQYPGAHYHNRKDLTQFPTCGRKDLLYPKSSFVPHPLLDKKKTRGVMKRMQNHDILLHFPYHSFNHFIDLLREASVDPLVREIKITQYRIAKNSSVANALMTAAKNGKSVTALIEPQARFDEQANIRWANEYREAGVKVILGVPGLKVHAKLCLITRNQSGKEKCYCAIGTGNFNESTARLYTDHLLLTIHDDIGLDVKRAFRFFENTFQRPSFEKLITSPFDLRSTLRELIENEISAAMKGRKAEIFIKLNNLSDLETIKLLYKASAHGVRVRLIVRSMYSVLADEKIARNLKGIGIVDRYLEHSRILMFANDGDPKYFLSSADFLPRNFDNRFEVLCPIEEKKLQQELKDYLQIQWQDNTKARILDLELSNTFRKSKKKSSAVRAQTAIRDYLSSR